MMAGLMDMIDGISAGISEAIGIPNLIGILLLLIFIGWVAVSNIKGDGKMLVISMAFFLSFAIFPPWIQFIVLVLGGIFMTGAIAKYLLRW